MNWRHASTTHSVSFDNTDLLWSYLACATIIPPPLFIQKLHTRFSKQELSFFYVREALNTCRLPHPTKRDNNSAATKPPALMESFSEDRVEYSSCYPNRSGLRNVVMSGPSACAQVCVSPPHAPTCPATSKHTHTHKKQKQHKEAKSAEYSNKERTPGAKVGESQTSLFSLLRLDEHQVKYGRRSDLFL